MQTARRPRSLALLKAGNSIAAKIAMIAITTRSSIKVNALAVRVFIFPSSSVVVNSGVLYH